MLDNLQIHLVLTKPRTIAYIERVLKALSFQPYQITSLIETSKALLIEPLKLKQERLNQKLQALQNINEKFFKLEERLMNNEIEASTYKTWFQKFKEEKAMLEIALDGKKKPKIDTSEDIIQCLLPELSNLYQIYEKGNISQKHTLIRGVFKDNLVWGSNMFRTTFIDPIFQDNLFKIK